MTASVSITPPYQASSPSERPQSPFHVMPYHLMPRMDARAAPNMRNLDTQASTTSRQLPDISSSRRKWKAQIAIYPSEGFQGRSISLEEAHAYESRLAKYGIVIDLKDRERIVEEKARVLLLEDKGDLTKSSRELEKYLSFLEKSTSFIRIVHVLRARYLNKEARRRLDRDFLTSASASTEEEEVTLPTLLFDYFEREATSKQGSVVSNAVNLLTREGITTRLSPSNFASAIREMMGFWAGTQPNVFMVAILKRMGATNLYCYEAKAWQERTTKRLINRRLQPKRTQEVEQKKLRGWKRNPIPTAKEAAERDKIRVMQTMQRLIDLNILIDDNPAVFEKNTRVLMNDGLPVREHTIRLARVLAARGKSKDYIDRVKTNRFSYNERQGQRKRHLKRKLAKETEEAIQVQSANHQHTSFTALLESVTAAAMHRYQAPPSPRHPNLLSFTSMLLQGYRPPVSFSDHTSGHWSDASGRGGTQLLTSSYANAHLQR